MKKWAYESCGEQVSVYFRKNKMKLWKEVNRVQKTRTNGNISKEGKWRCGNR